MSWPQTATLIVSIAAAVAAGTGVIVLSVNGIHSQVAISTGHIQAQVGAVQAQTLAFQTEAAADRRELRRAVDAYREKADADREAFRAEMRRLGERQAHVEGALSTAAASQQ